MHTAESNPDDVVECEERVARRNLRARSKAHAAALGETTDTMNRVCEAAGQEEDAFLAIASRRSLNRVEW